MNKNALIPRRKVLGLGVALAGLCAGCAVLPDAGSAESAAGSQTASGNKAADKVEKAPLEDINSVHLRDNPELYTVYDDSGVVTMYLTVSRAMTARTPTTAGPRSTIIRFTIMRPWVCHAIRSPLCFRSVMRTAPCPGSWAMG